VVGVAGLPVRQDYNARPKQAQDLHNLDAIFKGILYRAVGQIECLPPADAQQVCGFRCFSGALRGATPGSGFALGQIEYGGTQVARRHAKKSSTTRLLHVVAVSRDGQYIGRKNIRSVDHANQ
jgi:hypothetical protein